MIFGVTHLLGIRFAPRIKDLPEQRLWRLPEGGPYQHIESALAGNLNVNLIRDTWDEMLRMVASVKYGEERASRIVSKLATASSLNLLLAAIVVWNTAHLQACVRKLRSDGSPPLSTEVLISSPNISIQTN